MNQKVDSKEWASEFTVFLESDRVTPPSYLSDSIVEFVRKDLNPTFSQILTKLALVHVAIGGLSLLICSQFGMGEVSALTHFFMGFGELVCMALCGALFLGLTSLIAAMILSNSELRLIRKTFYAPLMILALISLALFILFGADVALNVAIVWLLGGIVAGILATEIGATVRYIVPDVV